MAQPLINPMNFEPRADFHVGSGGHCPPAQSWEERDLTGLTAGYVLVYALSENSGFRRYSQPFRHCNWAGPFVASDCVLEPRLILPVRPAVMPVDYGRILDELKSALDVTLSHVARCLRLQRSAVYKWYQGATPHAPNRSRIEAMREFAHAWRVAHLASLRTYWDVRVPGGQATLGEMLSGETLDVPVLRSAIRALATRPASVQSSRLGFPNRKRDRAKDREWLETNLPSTSHEDEE